ncbi:MAG: GUN4 domain-containing protein [Hassallia sp.]
MTDEIPVKKILMLSANPKGTKQLRLGEEIREIKEGLQLARQRDRFKIESAEAVRDIDIHRSILYYEPQIIHFSGHGAGEPGLIFEDNTGQQKLVDAEALAGLFDLFADQVECVLLNACYSEIQAKAIAQHINYVIGMSQEIGDKAAIKFAVGFYDALGAGRSVEFAYKLGCRVIRMAGIQEHLTPQLLRKEDLHGESINTTPVTTSPPQDARKASVVSPSPTLEETTITKYRQQVEEFAADGVISDIGIVILNSLQKKLGLTDEQAREVQEEVLEPYQIYKQQFTKKVAEQGYPLGEKAEAELKKLQNYYGIKDEYINLLKQEATPKSEKQVNYTRLRDLLKAGEWKDADQETLAVMLQATAREEEDYLNYESIENFPCTDLRSIDQLWVKYSNGRFGFSVQKRIWESVGQDYEKFGDRVGWRKMRTGEEQKGVGGLKQETQHKPEWLGLSDLTFDTSSPEGHLPRAFVRVVGARRRVCVLFSRVETCKRNI